MKLFEGHTFHIPVLGLGYSIDTPIKAAPYGISSVISLVDDALMEKMREFYCRKFDMPFRAISRKAEDFRAQRITSYLNMVEDIVARKFDELTKSVHQAGGELEKYLEMLPDSSSLKAKFSIAQKGRKAAGDFSKWLHEILPVGAIDVNIMTKLDKVNQKDGCDLPIEYNDAHAAVRGFANSKLSSALVLSAGMSPRLYSYLENFADFFPDKKGHIRKKITLKVSDFRSALIQGKMLAAKGLWISEYRIESGVNCGGHAFPTQGVLFGPILEEFKQKRAQLFDTCRQAYELALEKKKLPAPAEPLHFAISVQGGVGTSEEHRFLLDYYAMDRVGWGSPFLLVPEVVSIDRQTMELLANGKEADYYLSGLSPLGVPFNTIKGASMSLQRLKLAQEGKAGTPCTKGYLKFNTEFSEKPICTASRQYQSEKLNELASQTLTRSEHDRAYQQIIERECLCVGLGASTKMSKDIQTTESEKVTVCPGPNLAYFSKISTLKEMVDHIYGRRNILDKMPRPGMFVKELNMYLDLFKERVEAYLQHADDKREKKQLARFQQNLLAGISYYKTVLGEKKQELAGELDRLLSNYPVLTIDLEKAK